MPNETVTIETHEGRRGVLQSACWFWAALDEKTKADAADGDCVLSSYEGTPIIDYSRKHPIFSGLAARTQ